MSKREAKLYLNDIIEAIGKIETFVKGMDLGSFSGDIKTIDAVMKNFIVIGEAIKNLPPETRTDHPEIPWHQINGMRNKMIHEYFGVDEKVVWQAIIDDLPELKKQIGKLLN